jgi:hypothetical protein
MINLTGKYKNFYQQLSDNGKLLVKEILTDLTYSRLLAICDINKIYPNNTKDMYLKWLTEKSFYKKGEIRFGSKFKKDQFEVRSKTHKDKPKQYSTQFWVEKGLSVTDANLKIKKLQSQNGKKAWLKERQPINHNPYLPEFWVKKGYTESETIDLILDLKTKTNGGLKASILKYGLEKGLAKHKQRNDKRLKTILDKFGTTALTGHTSKESLRFFIPLYRKLRKLGFKRTDIYWGISGSREYATHVKGKNFFYDFTIKSKKIIIEYNNLFWHPREPEEWFGFGDYFAKKLYDAIKCDTIREQGYKVIIVWNDDNLEEKQKEILDLCLI